MQAYRGDVVFVASPLGLLVFVALACQVDDPLGNSCLAHLHAWIFIQHSARKLDGHGQQAGKARGEWAAK